MAEPARHLAPDNLAHLLGSSAATGEPPTFKPIATATPATAAADPAATVPGADLIFAMIEEHRAAYEAWRATGAHGGELASDGPVVDRETAALDMVIAIEPTSVPGLRA